MNQSIPAIPTRYAGVNFRSRLEARWAAFFDLLSWRWEYEPIDLAGYIPDFLVRLPAFGRAPAPWLIEAKPVHDLGDPEQRAAYAEAINRISQSGWLGPAAVVGSTYDYWRFTMRADPNDLRRTLDGAGWSPCAFTRRGLVLPESARNLDNDSWADALALWREAGNRVQWRPPA